MYEIYSNSESNDMSKAAKLVRQKHPVHAADMEEYNLNDLIFQDIMSSPGNLINYMIINYEQLSNWFT